MTIYRITVRELSLVEYSIEADSEDKARELIGTGNQQVANDHVVDWDIVEIEERKS
jgi:hypothetical protein